MSYSVSPACPIQFWVNGKPTFNEKTEFGIEPRCFSQLWNLSDEIRIQVNGVPTADLKLKVYNIDGEVVTSKIFTPYDLYYEVTFTGAELGLDGDFQFQIEMMYAHALGSGSFSLSGGDLTSTPRGTAVLGSGSFAFTGGGVTATYVPSLLYLESEIVTEAFGSQTFRSAFNNGLSNVDIILTGNGASGSDTIRYQSGVTVTVTKTTHGSIAQDSGSIVFLLNGAVQSTHNFLAGDNLSSIIYSYSGLVPTDTLKTEINEG